MDNSKDNTRTLVMLYQQHPCLYVVKSAEYHNRTKRDRAFQVICEQYKEITNLPITPDIAKKKINNVRSQYLDHLNKIKHSKASGASTDDVYKPSWWLFEEMSFLDPHIAQKKGESSIIISDRSSEASSIMNVMNDDVSEEIQFLDVQNALKSGNDGEGNIPENLSPTPSCSRSNTSRGVTSLTRKRKSETSSSSTDKKNDFWAVASNTLQMIQSEEKEDGIRHWTLYLESELRKIKDPKKLKRLQRQIINLVDDEDNE